MRIPSDAFLRILMVPQKLTSAEFTVEQKYYFNDKIYWERIQLH